MANIKIDYDGLTQQASSLSSIISSYESLITRMTNLNTQISDGWEGKASQAYSEMMTKYTSQAKEMESVLEACKGYAEKVISDFQTVDSQCAARIRNSF